MARPPRNLAPLFSPRAVAVVGATERRGRIGRIIFENLMAGPVPVYPVHPRETSILGRPTYPSIARLPDQVDLAVLAMGATGCVAAAGECAARALPFIIPVAGGFGETGPAGRALEEQLLAAVAGRSNIVGPNTLGIFSPGGIDTIFVDHQREFAPRGRLSFITQSGSVGTEALAVAANQGAGLRAFVGLGNRADIDEIDCLAHFGADPATDCVLVYVETLSDGRGFLTAARAVARDKPVLVLKAGRTAAGATAASSHTGRLAAADRVVDGAFRQFAIQRALDEEELLDAARVLAAAPLPSGRRVAIVSPGGGYGVMATDAICSPGRPARLELAPLTAATSERLREIAPPWASVANPIDLSASTTDDETIAAIAALIAAPEVDLILAVTLFAPPGISDRLVDRIIELQRTTTKPIIALVQHGAATNRLLRELYRGGVVGYPGVARAVRAIRFLVERAELVTLLEGAR